MRMSLWCILALVAVLNVTSADELQTVEETELLKLIKEEHYVVALFCPSSSMEKCTKLEEVITSVREDMMEILDGEGRLVKLMDSPNVEEYDVAKMGLPLVVMFRNGLPVIYDGPPQEDIMLEQLFWYKEPGVQDLDDSSFEHLTQAASGATTGDWLVMFFTPSCQLCHRLTAALETVACKHRGRTNVARINKETSGEKTGRRFELGLEDKPDFILFRHGSMYRYQVDKYDPESLSSFIAGFYKNYPAQAIPLPKSPFDELVQLWVDYLKGNKEINVGELQNYLNAYPLLMGSFLCVPVLLVVALLLFMRSDEEPNPREEEENEESKKED
eukprot:GFUD01121711.1.p1 GENE.GFUD01121711.1~~GFUD01121711.1.p1  ORF type:complete len:330 (-),score=111.08 GFUD01121711.1:332-1321(-)